MGNSDRTWRLDLILKMNVTVWLFLLLSIISFTTPVLSSEPRVVCYYTNWSVYRPGTARFNPQNINPYLCTHLIYAFGGFTKENSFKPFDKYQDIEKGGYAKFTGLKTYNKNLKTLLAIGGWNEGSSRFSPMVASRDRRKEFVRNAIKFLRQNRFDGLDLDWEYPAFRDGGKPKDRENYAKLVKELREEFEKEAEATGKPRLLLTMAVPAGIEYIQKGFDVQTMNQHLDWMNLLTYDYHSAFEPAVNHHAPLYPLEEPNEYSVDNELNIDYTIKFYLENGADRDKLVLGIPTYGRSYTLFNADAVEVGSPADGPGEQGDATREKGYLAYYEICEALKPKEAKRSPDSEEDDDSVEAEEVPWTVMHPNPNAMGPFAYKGNQWVGYDDIDIVKKKAEYVVENGLGGIMFWSIDNDDFRGTCHNKPYPLIEAAKEAYILKLGSTSNTVVTEKAIRTGTKSSSGNRRRNRPKSSTTTSTTTTTTGKPSTKSNKRKTGSISSFTSTTPAWNIITPEPPTTPDPGSDFKCTDEGFFPHPRDCKKYFWCLDSGPSNLGIVAHQFTCPSGLFFNKAADSCDFARNVLCKVTTTTSTTTTTPSTTLSTTVSSTTTTRRPLRLSTKNSALFRTTSTTTTPEPEESEEYEDEVVGDTADIDAEDPKVIKELIDLIKKVGGVEQLEKQLGLSETSSSLAGQSAGSTTPQTFNKKLYQKVLERTRGTNRFTSNNIIESSVQSRQRGPQNAGLEATADRDQLLKKDRPQYKTINRQRSSATQQQSEGIQVEEQLQNGAQTSSREQKLEIQGSVATTAKPLQYVNIRRARPSTTSDTADDTASRNALFERVEQPFVSISETVNSLDIASARRENVPEYVTIRRQRPSTEETTTALYQHSEEENEFRGTALEREISAVQPQYTSIDRSRSTTAPTSQEPNNPEPTTVLAVQISSFLNSPSSSEPISLQPETTVAQTEASSTTTSTPASTLASSSISPTRRTVLRRRGSTTTTPRSTTTTSPSLSTTQVPKRNFLRRTKATAPPETTETESATIDTSTQKYTGRGGSKFKAGNTTVDKNNIENRTRRPYLSGSSRQPPARNFVRRRLGGANVTSSTTSSSVPSSSAASTRRPFRVTNRRRFPLSSGTSSTIPVTTTTANTPTPNSAEPSTVPLVTVSPTEATTYDLDDYLEDDNADTIEDPTNGINNQTKSQKKQRRPLVTLKEIDQNPSATNEEERKRQSKKYSSTIKQNQLDDLLKLKTKSDETTEYRTTVDGYSAETALAIAAHQLITAPIPSIPNYDDDYKSTTRTPTTKQYQYTITYDPLTKTVQDFQSTTFSEPTGFNIKTDFAYLKDTSTPFSTVYDSSAPSDYTSKVFTTNTTPKTYTGPSFLTVYDYNTQTDFPKNSPAGFTSRLTTLRNEFSTYTDPTELVSRSSSTPTSNTRLSTLEIPLTGYSVSTLSPKVSSTDSYVQSENYRDSRQGFSAPNVISTGLLGVPQRVPSTARYSTEGYISVPAEEYSYSTTGYRGRAQDSNLRSREPAYFTKDYLLESPVTKTYDDEYQYQTVTTPKIPPRKVFRKKIQRKISTTIRPTLAPVVTPTVPRSTNPIISNRGTPPPPEAPTSLKSVRVPSKKPFEKIANEETRTYRPIVNYDYYDDSEEKVAEKYIEGTKVVVHAEGKIECLDVGNFPHPTSCKKFISCARMEGSVLGWEYVCPKGLSFDPVGGICNWSAGLGCDEKDI